jgi:hypothetical protein
MDMERATRPCIVAAAVLATGGLIAVTPAVTPTLPDVQVPNIDLTADTAGMDADVSFLQQLAEAQISSNSQLGDQESVFDPGLVTDETKFDGMLPGSDNALNDVLNINESALDAELNSGDTANSLSAGLALSPLPDGGSAAGAAGSSDPSVASAASDVTALSTSATLQTAAADFYSTLLSNEQDFNTDLVGNEQAIVDAVSGNDGTLNDVVTHGFNLFNMLYAAQELGLNGVVGVHGDGYDPQDFTQALLLGDPDGVGGIQGMFDQSQALLAAIAALQASGFTGLSDNLDTDALNTALLDFLTTASGSPFGDAFDTALAPDASNIIDAIFGTGA